MTAGLILAGGTSERLNGLGNPKQFVEICGIPLIMYSLKVFENCENIDIVAIVVEDQWQYKLSAWLDEYKIEKVKIFTRPGKTRQHSIYNGLLALREYNPDLIAIHDSARPLVTVQDIDTCIRAIENFDGATPIIPIKDTIYKSENGEKISDLLNRDELFAGQTPESYNFAKYLQAHKAISDEEIGNIRGSSEIAFKAGMMIHLCKGNPQNFKITTSADLEYFEYLLGRKGYESMGSAQQK